VELRYLPLSLRIGLGLAGLACAGLLVLALRPGWLGEPQARPTAGS
jgi:hypothetical protein